MTDSLDTRLIEAEALLRDWRSRLAYGLAQDFSDAANAISEARDRLNALEQPQRSSEPKAVWIARAPHDERRRATALTAASTAERYREMGWEVVGPYERWSGQRRNHAPWCCSAHEGPCLAPSLEDLIERVAREAPWGFSPKRRLQLVREILTAAAR